MAVRQVNMWSVTPQRAADWMAQATKAKAIAERHGGKMRVSLVQFGGPGGVVAVSETEYADMEALAAAQAKGAADMQAFWAEAWADPTATAVTGPIILADIPI